MSTFDTYAAQRRRESLQARELDELAEGTEAIERATHAPLLWALLIGGLVGAVFTGGISLLVTLAAGIAMSGGPGHMASAAMPKTVDIVAPQAGCVRVLSSLAAIVLVLITLAFILALIAFNAGGL